MRVALRLVIDRACGSGSGVGFPLHPLSAPPFTCEPKQMGLKALPSRLSAAAPKLKPAPKRVEQFYSSPQWRALVARRKLDPDYFAALVRRRSGERVILDHKRERKDGGSDLDPRNTEWLTFSEHQAKTAKERARRARGAGGR
jgi:5-methylcytosine-specific restriction protein A